MPLKKYLIICFILSFLTVTKSQTQATSYLNEAELSWFVSVNYGYQMSGIKSEDFVNSNYSPLFNSTLGKWFNHYLALQIGYKGFYFNYIFDDVKHHYNYFYGEAVINLNNAVHPDRINTSWNLLFHTGAGYFYNHVYDRANIYANIGVQNTYQLTNKFQAALDISSIIGWDIYQGDEDILSGITVGVTYIFNIGRGYTKEQENKYGLVFNYTSSEYDQGKAINKGIELLKQKNIKEEFQKRCQKMLTEKIDVTAFMVWFIENYPVSFKIIKENPDFQYNFK